MIRELRQRHRRTVLFLAVVLPMGFIAARTALEPYSLYHAAHGTFTLDLGKMPEALEHFRKAERLATLSAEREFLARRCRECEG